MSSTTPPPGEGPQEPSPEGTPPPPPYGQPTDPGQGEPPGQPPQYGQPTDPGQGRRRTASPRSTASPPTRARVSRRTASRLMASSPTANSLMGTALRPTGYEQPSPYPAQRPGVVTAAAIIAMIMSGLTGLAWLFFGVTATAGGDAIIDAIRDDQATREELDNAGVTLTQLEDGIQVFGVVALIVGVLMLLAIWPRSE